jgi:hypothetical protein
VWKRFRFRTISYCKPAICQDRLGTDIVKVEERGRFALCRNGTFSKETLADLAPASFLIGSEWVKLLEASAARHGASWLHSLYLGTAELEMGNAPKALALFNRSLALQPSVHAERALAIFAR